MCMLCISLFVLLSFFFLLANVLSVLLRFTDPDYLPLVSSHSSCTRKRPIKTEYSCPVYIVFSLDDFQYDYEIVFEYK